MITGINMNQRPFIVTDAHFADLIGCLSRGVPSNASTSTAGTSKGSAEMRARNRIMEHTIWEPLAKVCYPNSNRMLIISPLQ